MPEAPVAVSTALPDVASLAASLAEVPGEFPELSDVAGPELIGLLDRCRAFSLALAKGDQAAYLQLVDIFSELAAQTKSPPMQAAPDGAVAPAARDEALYGLARHLNVAWARIALLERAAPSGGESPLLREAQETIKGLRKQLADAETRHAETLRSTVEAATAEAVAKAVEVERGKFQAEIDAANAARQQADTKAAAAEAAKRDAERAKVAATSKQLEAENREDETRKEAAKVEAANKALDEANKRLDEANKRLEAEAKAAKGTLETSRRQQAATVNGLRTIFPDIPPSDEQGIPKADAILPIVRREFGGVMEGLKKIFPGLPPGENNAFPKADVVIPVIRDAVDGLIAARPKPVEDAAPARIEAAEQARQAAEEKAAGLERDNQRLKQEAEEANAKAAAAAETATAQALQLIETEEESRQEALRQAQQAASDAAARAEAEASRAEGFARRVAELEAGPANPSLDGPSSELIVLLTKLVEVGDDARRMLAGAVTPVATLPVPPPAPEPAPASALVPDLVDAGASEPSSDPIPAPGVSETEAFSPDAATELSSEGGPTAVEDGPILALEGPGPVQDTSMSVSVDPAEALRVVTAAWRMRKKRLEELSPELAAHGDRVASDARHLGYELEHRERQNHPDLADTRTRHGDAVTRLEAVRSLQKEFVEEVGRCTEMLAKLDTATRWHRQGREVRDLESLCACPAGLGSLEARFQELEEQFFQEIRQRWTAYRAKAAAEAGVTECAIALIALLALSPPDTRGVRVRSVKSLVETAVSAGLRDAIGDLGPVIMGEGASWLGSSEQRAKADLFVSWKTPIVLRLKRDDPRPDAWGTYLRETYAREVSLFLVPA